MTDILRNLLAYGSDGQVIVIGHQREVLVYSGVDESPLWRCECDADIVSVGACPLYVCALDQNGEWNCWDALTGESRQTLRLSGPTLGMAVAENGDCAVFSDEGISLIRSVQIIQFLAVPSITAVGWSADHSLLACGEDTGRLSVYARTDDREKWPLEPLMNVPLGDPIRSIVWNPDGSWLASAGKKIWQIASHGESRKSLFDSAEKSPGLIAVSQTGGLLACTLDDRDVLAFHVGHASLAGSFTYLDREVTGLAFGNHDYLGIGLDTGDGNKIDFNKPQGGVARTDPHPGRPHNRWMLKASIIPLAPDAVPDSASVETRTEPRSFSSWTGPFVGGAVGFVTGLKMCGNAAPMEAILITSSATAIGLAGGSVMVLLDFLKKK